MALGKNIGTKGVSSSTTKKEIASKSTNSTKKIKKKKLISKSKISKAKKPQSINDNPLIRYLTEETQKRKTELRSRYTQEIEELKSKKVQFIVFKIGDEEFGVGIDRIKEVVPFTGVAKIPNSPKHIVGATRVRNQTIMAIDLQAKFRLSLASKYQFTIALKNREHKVGILVNELPMALKVDGDLINASLSNFESAIEDETYIKGIIELEDRLIFYLDIDGLIEGDKAIVVPNEMAVE
jgi:purine-binding chemotaxis protein CheW